MKISFLFYREIRVRDRAPTSGSAAALSAPTPLPPPRVKLENGPSEIPRIKIPDPIAEILRDEKWDIEEAEG